MVVHLLLQSAPWSIPSLQITWTDFVDGVGDTGRAGVRRRESRILNVSAEKRQWGMNNSNAGLEGAVEYTLGF